MGKINALFNSKVNRILSVIFIFIIMLAAFPVNAAEVPYTTYSYWTNVGSQPVEVQTKPMYEVENIITSSSLNVGEFQSIDDICADETGNLYILDGKDSKIIVIDSKYKVKKIISKILDIAIFIHFFIF